MPAKLLVGDLAPDFADLRGRRAVLCFFPGNDTPGGIEQLCALRDAWAVLRGRAAVVGINADTPEHHRRLIEKYALPFPLLSDADHEIARAFGLWLDDGGGGDAEGGESTERATFILDADGRVEAVQHRADPAGHLEWLLRALG